MNVRELTVAEVVAIKFDPAPGIGGASIEISRVEAEALLAELANVLGADS